MRRTAEWLLLPLFLLPIVVGIGLHLWAQHDYERRLDRVRADGAGTLARILAREENEDPRRRMWSHSAALTRQVTNPRWATTKVVTRLEWEGQTAYLFGAWPQEVARPTPTWVGAASYPAGLTAGGLSDAGVRLAVQTGETKAFTENEDDVAAAFRTLLEEPRLLLLSQTPLPAQTKLWLVRRWKNMGVTIPQLGPAEKVLQGFADIERFLADDPDPLPRGVHRRGAYQVQVDDPAAAVWFPYPPPPPVAFDTDHLPARHRLLDDDELVQAVFLGLLEVQPSPALLWQGRVEAPLAGTWMLWPRHGLSYAQVPTYARWRGPVIACLLAFLLLPTALLISFRRRRRLDEARVRFINEMAHDLRTPLTSLRLHAEMLEGGRGDPEKTERYARSITRESTRMTGLLANLLDLSRLEDGRRHLQSEAVRVAPLVDDAVRDFCLLYPARSEDVSTNGPLDVVVQGDGQALGRCLANLLDNAGKYTEPGVPICVRWEEDGREVVIRVADEGPGLPAEEQTRAFERYERGTRARRDGLPGSGLGLSLVRELLTELQGTVRWVSSKRGAVIEMRVPRGGAE